MKGLIMVNKKLNQLGNKVSFKNDPEKALLEKVSNPHLKEIYVIRFSIPEFTSLCPVTGQPDFAKIFIDYVPNSWIVEIKIFKIIYSKF